LYKSDITIKDVIGDFGSLGSHPVGICRVCRQDILMIARDRGVNSVTLEKVVGNKVKGYITIDNNNFDEAIKRMNAIPSSANKLFASNSYWKIFEELGKFKCNP